MLPTKTANPKVLSIQPFESKDINSSKKATIEGKKEKSFSMNVASIIPLRSDITTLLKYSAKTIARRDGKSERAESSSMVIQSKLYR